LSTVSFPNIDDLNLVDDLDVSVDQDSYVEQQAPLPIAAGRYGFRIVDWDLARDRKGQPDANGQLPVLKQDGKYPIITLKKVEVVYPAENARPVFLYHDVRTKPFSRTDRKTGQDVQVNNLGDLLRSADATASFSGLNEGLNLLKSMTAQGAIFHARLDWIAKDFAAIKAGVEEIKATATASGQSLDSKPVKDAINQVYKTYTRQGMNKFKNAEGVIVPFMPSAVEGEDDIPVRVEIPMSGFIPASQVAAGQVKFGPTVR
jgi:hypothetical protein